jgi:hypothetical protein
MPVSKALFGSGITIMQACNTGGLGHMGRYMWLRVDNKLCDKILRCTLRLLRMLCMSWMVVALLSAQVASQLKHISLYQSHIPAICDVLHVHSRYILTYQAAITIEQRAPRVARIDGSVCLNHILQEQHSTHQGQSHATCTAASHCSIHKLMCPALLDYKGVQLNMMSKCSHQLQLQETAKINVQSNVRYLARTISWNDCRLILSM